MIAPDFDPIALYYDVIVRFTFGQKIWEAQKEHLGEIRNDSSILILGGGTGRILNWMPSDCAITYLEVSQKMIGQARLHGKAQFVNCDFLVSILNEKFDWIVCPFFLDCFEEEDLKKVLEKIRGMMAEQGRLLIMDFQTKNWKQKMIVKCMVLFFRWTANLPTKKLLPIAAYVREANFSLIKSRSFHNDFIFSDIYKNKETF